jgi:osmotically-inducible protein OsmY
MRMASARLDWRSGAGVIAALVVAVYATGCPAMAITTAATTVASATADDRSYEEQGKDDETKAKVEKAFLEQDPKLSAKVDVDVFDGRTMLTGVVDTDEERSTAVWLTRGAVGERAEIFDDIQVLPSGAATSGAKNFVLNRELGAKLLGTEGLSSQSFEHRVVNKVAYIIGQAPSDYVVEKARQTALGIDGIDRVVTHIEVKP